MLLTGAGFGMLAGGLESAAALIRQRLLHRPLEMGPELGWQLPLTDAALFLTRAGFVTGTTLDVDGGYSHGR